MSPAAASHLFAPRPRLADLHLVGDEKIGADILDRALDAPLRQIAENAGVEGGIIVERVKHASGNNGWNAMTGDMVDMLAAGIVDPAKVIRSALQNAASIAIMILTTDCAITDAKEDKPDASAGMPGGMGMGY